jgi:peptidoglycan-associated lipoprotein
MRVQWSRAAFAVVAAAALGTAAGCGGSQPPEPELVASEPPDVASFEEPPVRDETPVETLQVPSLKPIHFEYNEYRITPAARMELENVSVILKGNPHWTVLLEGHCDERGTDEYNLTLGENRAQSAKRYLVSLGIEESRFRTVSFGEERPAEPGHDERSWSRNRRAELRVQVPGV